MLSTSIRKFQTNQIPVFVESHAVFLAPSKWHFYLDRHFWKRCIPYFDDVNWHFLKTTEAVSLRSLLQMFDMLGTRTETTSNARIKRAIAEGSLLVYKWNGGLPNIDASFNFYEEGYYKIVYGKRTLEIIVTGSIVPALVNRLANLHPIFDKILDRFPIPPAFQLRRADRDEVEKYDS